MRLIKIKYDISEVYGYTTEEVKAAIIKSFNYFSSVANVRFDFVDSGQQITMRTSVLYGGKSGDKHIHYRGLRSGNTLSIHSGYIPADKTNEPQAYYIKLFASPQSIASVMAHEIGHWLGWGHSTNTNCLMHSNANASKLCDDEIKRSIQILGAKPTVENPDPEPPPIDPGGTLAKGTKLKGVNLIVNRGSVLTSSGERIWINGDRIVVTDATVHTHAKPDAIRTPDMCCTFQG